MNKKINHKQLTFDSEYRGYNQTRLASEIPGLSQSNLSKFEKGIPTLSDELIYKIIKFLDFPEDFLYLELYTKSINAHYRKKSKILKTEKIELDQTIKIISHLIDEMSESLDLPEFGLQQIDVEDGYSPSYIASYVRRRLNLRDKPVKDIFSILESQGIIIVPINTDINSFDGVSFITEYGFPVMVINDNMSNDRKRLTIAHELGHIIMHSEDFLISEFRDKEKEAFEFAAEFLMPEVAIKNQLMNLKLSELVGLKRYWLTSIASLIRRARDLKCIDQDRYIYFNTELSRSGYKKKEPVEVVIDKPTIIKSAYELYTTQLDYSATELSDVFNLPLDIIQKFFASHSEKNKLRIISMNIS